jgi:hypothetical protein
VFDFWRITLGCPLFFVVGLNRTNSDLFVLVYGFCRIGFEFLRIVCFFGEF